MCHVSCGHTAIRQLVEMSLLVDLHCCRHVFAVLIFFWGGSDQFQEGGLQQTFFLF